MFQYLSTQMNKLKRFVSLTKKKLPFALAGSYSDKSKKKMVLVD